MRTGDRKAVIGGCGLDAPEKWQRRIVFDDSPWHGQSQGIASRFWSDHVSEQLLAMTYHRCLRERCTSERQQREKKVQDASCLPARKLRIHCSPLRPVYCRDCAGKPPTPRDCKGPIAQTRRGMPTRRVCRRARRSPATTYPDAAGKTMQPSTCAMLTVVTPRPASALETSCAPARR